MENKAYFLTIKLLLLWKCRRWMSKCQAKHLFIQINSTKSEMARYTTWRGEREGNSWRERERKSLGGCEKFLKFLAPRKTAIPLAALPSLSPFSPRFLPDFSPFSPYFLCLRSPPLFSLCMFVQGLDWHFKWFNVWLCWNRRSWGGYLATIPTPT